MKLQPNNKFEIILNEAIELRKIRMKNLLSNLENQIDLNYESIEQKINSPFSFKMDSKFKFVIYRISINSKVVNEIVNEYNEFKNSTKEFKISSFNNETNFKEYKTLYVGSSKSLISRINQHLGNGSKKVYSLHLKKWIKNVDLVNIELLFLEEKYKDVVNEIENGIWDLVKPVFGKKGVNLNQSSGI